MTQAVAADDRGERAGEAAGVNVACRTQAETESEMVFLTLTG
jgi:hypothetical protein